MNLSMICNKIYNAIILPTLCSCVDTTSCVEFTVTYSDISPAYHLTRSPQRPPGKTTLDSEYLSNLVTI